MSEPLFSEVVTHRNIAKKTYEKLRCMANTESATGLLNQRGIISMTESVISNLKRAGLDPKFTITMLDMIGLKALNQKYTELGANRLIKESADAIGNTIRESDLAGRWGGDEFVIVSFDTNLEGTQNLISKITDAQPDEIKYNYVYKIFNSNDNVKSSLDEVYGSIEKVK